MSITCFWHLVLLTCLRCLIKVTEEMLSYLLLIHFKKWDVIQAISHETLYMAYILTEKLLKEFIMISIMKRARD